MNTPVSNYVTDGWDWAADNGCFSERWDHGRWRAWIQSDDTAMFAVVPDRVGDAATTRRMWDEHAGTVINAGHHPYYVIQNGQETVDVPWNETAGIFIGGDDAFKLGPTAHRITVEAVERALPIHMGRVNSYRRLLAAQRWGCSTADGTFLAFGPDVNTPRLLAWLRRLANDDQQLQLI